jgi:hypothetical protein
MNRRLFASTPLLFLGLLQAAQVCDLTLTACPKQLPTGTLTVPMDVISLDARIPSCKETGVITATVKPSIVFIIDNSGSMSMGNYDDAQETDPEEARFSVVSTLLDDINKSNPGTEVGMVFFSRRLQLDHRDNPVFQTAFPGDTSQHDSYMPLTALNKKYANGRTGLDTLRSLLMHDTDGNMTYATKRLASRGTNDNSILTDPIAPGRENIRRGTDITLGFEAAKLAIKTSTSPVDNQFFIFLSDGDAGSVDSGRTNLINNYQQGTGVPTTFTVFFSRNNTVPAGIRTMTTNIQTNKYSNSNPLSANYSVGVPATQLQTLLQNNVLNRILTVATTGKAVEVAITGGAKQSTTTRGTDSTSFLVSTRMPLNAGLTEIKFNYTHSFTDTTVNPAAIRDTLISYAINVQRGNTTTLPSNVTKTCRDQADLALLSGGQALTVVTANQANLEVRVTPTTGQSCANCTVKLSPSASADLETLPLAPQGSYFAGNFVRIESITPVVGDGKLQHKSSDSLVLVWANPENPLDVVRRSFPYQGILPVLSLFSGDKELTAVTADQGLLEVRLTLASGETCVSCQVQILASTSADRENVTLAGAASPFRGTFTHEVGINPVAGDGKFWHSPSDSIILVYVNPLTQQTIRRAYAYTDILPTLSLFHNGKELDTVTAEHGTLEIHLTLPSGLKCNACQVQVLPSGSPDRENVAMSGAASPYRGSFAREVGLSPVLGDGKLHHLANDSIVLLYVNPVSQQKVRRSYLYIDFKNEIGLIPHNTVAHAPQNEDLTNGSQWIIADAPNLKVEIIGKSGTCCEIRSVSTDPKSPDFLHYIGQKVEASREFSVEMAIFTNVGQFVNKVAFTVTRPEFIKLTAVVGKETRYLRLLWKGFSLVGSRAGTGAYILRTTVTLLPVPGLTASTKTTTDYVRMGLIRNQL